MVEGYPVSRPMRRKMMVPRFLRYGVLRRLVQLGLLLALTAAGPAPPKKLVWAFGDSLTAGLGLPPDQGYVPQLQRALRQAGVDAEVRNGGVSGDTAAQGRARLLWGLRGLGRKPDLVLLELGANDMLRGLPTDQIASNLDRILIELKRRQIPVLIMGMRAAPNLGADYRGTFESIYPRLAKRYGVPLYPFFLDGVAGNRTLIQADGLHPNAKGVAIVVRKTLPAVRAGLGR
jgi:acyl-CoA thioesterase-1